jgi:hypothetical protein
MDDNKVVGASLEKRDWFIAITEGRCMIIDVETRNQLRDRALMVIGFERGMEQRSYMLSQSTEGNIVEVSNSGMHTGVVIYHRKRQL